MTNVMTYKGYVARIEYDDDDGIFFGNLAGIRDGVGFHADSVEELRAAFREAVDDYVETREAFCGPGDVPRRPRGPPPGRPGRRARRQEPQPVGRGGARPRRGVAPPGGPKGSPGPYPRSWK